MTESPASAQPRCWHCDLPIDTQDAYCRRCGQGQGSYVFWYYQVWGIALLTVTGLGPFSLPLVWRTPKLESRGRWVMTAFITAFTLLIVYRIVVLVRMLQTALSGVY